MAIDAALDILDNPDVDKGDYKRTLGAARAELEHLLEQQEEIEKRIAQLKQAIIALSPLGEESSYGSLAREWAALGITDSCREILKAADRPLTPLEVKQQLINTGHRVEKYTNLMASIHTVLKRLKENDEVISVALADGSAAYQWKAMRYGRLARAAAGEHEKKQR